MGMTVHVKKREGELPISVDGDVLDPLYNEACVSAAGSSDYLIYSRLLADRPRLNHDHGADDLLHVEFGAPQVRPSIVALNGWRCSVAEPQLMRLLMRLTSKKGRQIAAEQMVGKQEWGYPDEVFNEHGAPTAATRERLWLATCYVRDLIELCQDYPEAYLEISW